MSGATAELRELLALLRDSGVIEYDVTEAGGVTTRIRLAPKLAQVEPKQEKPAQPDARFAGLTQEQMARALAHTRLG